jgi:DNA-binding LacI/PurR family transcriptional regulator
MPNMVVQIKDVAQHAGVPLSTVFGVISALQAANLRVPEGISVVGVNDIIFIFACLSSRPLTTIHVPREELGRRSFEALERMLSPFQRYSRQTASENTSCNQEVGGGAPKAIVRAIAQVAE